MEKREVDFVEFLFGEAEFALGGDLRFYPVDEMVFGELVFVGSAFFMHDFKPCDLFILDIGINTFKFGSELIIFFEVLFFDLMMLKLEIILGIVEGGDLEDEFFVDVGAELVGGVWVRIWVHYWSSSWWQVCTMDYSSRIRLLTSWWSMYSEKRYIGEIIKEIKSSQI